MMTWCGVYVVMYMMWCIWCGVICGVIWCGVHVRYGVICGVVCYGVIRCGVNTVIWCGVIYRFDMTRCNYRWGMIWGMAWPGNVVWIHMVLRWYAIARGTLCIVVSKPPVDSEPPDLCSLHFGYTREQSRALSFPAIHTTNTIPRETLPPIFSSPFGLDRLKATHKLLTLIICPIRHQLRRWSKATYKKFNSSIFRYKKVSIAYCTCPNCNSSPAEPQISRILSSPRPPLVVSSPSIGRWGHLLANLWFSSAKETREEILNTSDSSMHCYTPTYFFFFLGGGYIYCKLFFDPWTYLHLQQHKLQFIQTIFSYVEKIQFTRKQRTQVEYFTLKLNNSKFNNKFQSLC